ncbi:MAG TPA: hypothetical protein VFN83_11675 [Gemmatimonadales bacterium]|jgi:hypothetical protein|nr:hypothetical protein [Gemmatimonadales bacterium]
MKSVLAALLLFVQFQPVLGTVVCVVGSERAARQECQMPETRHPAAPYAVSDGMASQGCPLAGACLPAPLAVPGISNRLETAAAPCAAPARLGATSPRDISLAPPFHPPRA